MRLANWLTVIALSSNKISFIACWKNNRLKKEWLSKLNFTTKLDTATISDGMDTKLKIEDENQIGGLEMGIFTIKILLIIDVLIILFFN